MYKRLIKDAKKTLYKTLGKTSLTFEQLEAVVIDIEKHLNNRPLNYFGSEGGEEQVLTPNIVMWRQNSHKLEDGDDEKEELDKLNKRLQMEDNTHGSDGKASTFTVRWGVIALTGRQPSWQTLSL